MSVRYFTHALGSLYVLGFRKNAEKGLRFTTGTTNSSGGGGDILIQGINNGGRPRGGFSMVQVEGAALPLPQGMFSRASSHDFELHAPEGKCTWKVHLRQY